MDLPLEGSRVLPILEVPGVPPWDYTYFCWGFVDANLRVREVGVYTPGATDRGGLRQTLSMVGKEGLRDETESGYFFLGAFDVVGPFFIGASYEARGLGTGTGYIFEHGCAVMRINYINSFFGRAPVSPIPE